MVKTTNTIFFSLFACNKVTSQTFSEACSLEHRFSIFNNRLSTGNMDSQRLYRPLVDDTWAEDNTSHCRSIIIDGKGTSYPRPYLYP